MQAAVSEFMQRIFNPLPFSGTADYRENVLSCRNWRIAVPECDDNSLATPGAQNAVGSLILEVFSSPC
jgi:hypothetical protein